MGGGSALSVGDLYRDLGHVRDHEGRVIMGMLLG